VYNLETMRTPLARHTPLTDGMPDERIEQLRSIGYLK